MRDFLHDCVASAPCEAADRLREARCLFAAAGCGPAGIPAMLPAAAAHEAMLASGSFESAALALLGADASFMLSRGGNGVCLASIALPGCTAEVTAEGTTPALALLAAQVSAILAETGPCEDVIRPGKAATARLN